MISALDRRKAVTLIKETIEAGAPAKKACDVLAISLRTYQRWTQDPEVKEDGRPQAERPSPANKLSPEERQQLLATCNLEEYRSLPPSQIVPALADKGKRDLHRF